MTTLYHRFTSEPWLITPSGAAAYASVFRYEAPTNAASSKGRNFFGDPIRETEFRDGVAIVPVDGTLVHKAGFLDKGFGARSHEDVSSAVADAASKGMPIVLDFNSPGGTVAGTPETASVIADASKKVPVYSYCEGVCASAAYWMASQAKAGVFASPSTSIGSIGAILESISFARYLEAAGIDAKVFTSSPLKGVGHPLNSMSKDHADHLQGVVNTAGQMFTNAVRQNRPGVKAEALTGATFFAAQAQALGLIDGIVSSLADVVSMAARSKSSVQSSPSAAGSSKPISFTGRVLLAKGCGSLAALRDHCSNHPTLD
jgi:capsid assembly protease